MQQQRSAIQETARAAYEQFHQLPPGSATLMQVRASSPGIGGWARHAALYQPVEFDCGGGRDNDRNEQAYVTQVKTPATAVTPSPHANQTTIRSTLRSTMSRLSSLASPLHQRSEHAQSNDGEDRTPDADSEPFAIQDDEAETFEYRQNVMYLPNPREDVWVDARIVGLPGEPGMPYMIQTGTGGTELAEPESLET